MELHADIRTEFGKKTAALRKVGKIPAEVYGNGTENSHISVDEKAFMKLYRGAGGNSLITLKIGANPVSVLIADVHMDHISGKPLSADFHAVRKGEKVHVSVPVTLVGEAPAKKNGYDVIQALNELEIETLPTNIPPSFEIDISGLEDATHDISVKEIAVPKGIKIVTPEETVVVAVTEKQKEEEAAPPPSAEGTEPAVTEGSPAKE
jgi:large subunit ribosomal protein L25